MKNKFLKRLTALLAVCVLVLPVFSAFPKQSVQAAAHDNAVVIDVERFTIGQGFYSEPTWVELKEGDNVVAVLKRFIGAENCLLNKQENYLSGIKGADLGPDNITVPAYITEMTGGDITTESLKEDWYGDDEVKDLSEFVYGQRSGWMYSVNNVFPNVGIGEYKPAAGDVIRFQYTVNYGSDVGGGYSTGEDQTLALSNKDALVKAMADANEILKVKTASEDLKTVYEEAKTAVADAVKPQADIDSLTQKLNSAVEAAKGGQTSDTEVDTMVSKATASMVKEVPAPGFENSWYVMDLARTGAAVPEGYFKAFADAVYADLDENDGKLSSAKSKSTEYSRTILALTAMGENAANFGEKSYNLFGQLSDMKYVTKQGRNGAIWALIALNSHPSYSIPENANAKEQVTRESLIDKVLSYQKNGGWNLSGSKPDTDMTGMAVYALAPYYNTNDKVKVALDEAVETLSGMQNDNGNFGTGGKETCESTVQAIVALCSLGINPDTDARFVKNGNSAIDALKSYYKEEGDKYGFMHLKAGEGSAAGEGAAGIINSMATEQAVYALNSYQRLLAGQKGFFDMSDVDLGDVALGDVNGDGSVDSLDATLILKYDVGFLELNETQLKASDMNQDGDVNSQDATLILKKDAGII